MPLTTSHAAAAWPLSRLFPALPLAAIVIGTMAPDFEYLLRLAPRGRAWHTPGGLLLYAVPAALAVWLAWRTLVRVSLASLLPPAVTASWPHQRLTIRECAGALVGAAFGAVSHVLWDGLGHHGGWAVELVPALQRMVSFGPLGELHAYRVVQHLGTLVGGAAILLWALRWWRSQPRDARALAPSQRRRLGAGVLTLLLLASCGAMLNGQRAPAALPSILGYAAVGWMLGAAATLALWSLVERARARWRT